MSQTFLFLEATGFKLISIILRKSIEKEASATHIKLKPPQKKQTGTQQASTLALAKIHNQVGSCDVKHECGGLKTSKKDSLDKQLWI